MDGSESVGEMADIDRSFFDLTESLKVLGLDGECIVTGNVLLATGDDEAEEESADVWSGILDPEEVQRNWRQLQGVTFERLMAAYRETPNGKSTNDQGDDEYLEFHFVALKDVYRRAADAGAAMKFLVC
jgi:hypothetical protein